MFAAAFGPVLRREQKLQLLYADTRQRLAISVAVVQHQLETMQSTRVAAAISTRVHDSISKSQREFLLRQQLKAIREELGEKEGAEGDDLAALAARLDVAGLPEEVRAGKLLDRSVYYSLHGLYSHCHGLYSHCHGIYSPCHGLYHLATVSIHLVTVSIHLATVSIHLGTVSIHLATVSIHLVTVSLSRHTLHGPTNAALSQAVGVRVRALVSESVSQCVRERAREREREGSVCLRERESSAAWWTDTQSQSQRCGRRREWQRRS
jgi:hypothetical protein